MLPLKDEDRVRILSAVARKGPGYAARRVVVITLSLLGLLAVPLLGIARVDVWGGNHVLLGESVSVFRALQGVVVAIVALYGVTFATNFAFGRFFCGWGCPVGYVSRLGENVQRARKDRRRALLHHALGALFVAVFLAAVMLWWVDPRVLTEGSPGARIAVLSVFAVLWAGGFLHAFLWRFGFCLNACPIGLYYRFVTSRAPVGIAFSEVPDPCTQCRACITVCPVDLDPRKLGEEQPGLEPGSETRFGDAECLRCGDCVEACRMVFAVRKDAVPPLRFGRLVDLVPVERRDPSAPESSADAPSKLDAGADRTQAQGQAAGAPPPREVVR